MRDIGKELLGLSAQLGPRHLGHPLVGEQHRDRLARENFERLARRRRGEHAEPPLEPEPEGVEVPGVVVDVQDG